MEQTSVCQKISKQWSMGKAKIQKLINKARSKSEQQDTKTW